MGVEAFLQHLDDPSPGFRCSKAGSGERRPSLVVRVSNLRNEPADEKGLTELRARLGPAAGSFARLYDVNDGLILYAQTEVRQGRYDPPYPAGLRFFPVRDWDRRSEMARNWLGALLFEDEEAEDWMKLGLAFAEICHSGNYFLVQPSGPQAGKIYFQWHESLWDWEAPIAEGLDAFLELILADPAGFLDRMGCCTRYADGRSEDQWIPEVYVPNA